MTIQISDPFHWKKQSYVLIDIEKEKRMFSEDEIKGLQRDDFRISSCWRGYWAEYFIEEDILYGILHSLQKEKKKVKKKALSFSGACVIAKRPEAVRFWTTDFLSSYLWADEAYELHFCDGRLTEVRDLSIAIEEYTRILAEESVSGNKTWLADNNLAKKHLKYDYDTRSYKWR